MWVYITEGEYIQYETLNLFPKLLINKKAKFVKASVVADLSYVLKASNTQIVTLSSNSLLALGEY